MAELYDDPHFWLPSKFLCDDDDDVAEPEFCGFPAESGIVNDSDGQMVRSSLDVFTQNDNFAKAGFLTRSTLCPLDDCSWGFTARDTHEVAGMRAHINGDGYGSLGWNYGGLLAASRNHMLSVQLQQQRKIMEAKRILVMMERMHQQHQQQLKLYELLERGVDCGGVMNGGFVSSYGNANLVGLSEAKAAWSPVQQAQQCDRRAQIVRKNPTGKRECAGTGVFLPRHLHIPTQAPPRKMPPSGCSKVLIPAKVVQALSTNLDEMDVQNHFATRPDSTNLHPIYNIDGSATARIQGNNVAAHPAFARSNFRHPLVIPDERLPQGWSYC